MKVVLVPSSVSERGKDQHQFLTSFTVNDTLAIDAGSLGLFGTVGEQAAIKHVLISHTHIDHIGSLPVFVENAFEGRPDCVTIHGSDAVLDCLRRDIFNDRVWVDFIRLSTEKAPFLKLSKLEAGKTEVLEDLRITPVPVNHIVPTFGFVVEETDAAILVVSDTGPTDQIWEVANVTPKLKAVFLEATFPNSMEELAQLSKHLTPALFAREVQKLEASATVIAVHMKPRFREQIVQELSALAIPNLQIGQMGKPYFF